MKSNPGTKLNGKDKNEKYKDLGLFRMLRNSLKGPYFFDISLESPEAKPNGTSLVSRSPLQKGYIS